jgi:seryl-tRNA synthetase
MLDTKFIRNNPDLVRQGIAAKGESAALDEFLSLDQSRREKVTEVEQIKARRNAATQQIARFKKEGVDATAEIAEMKALGERVKELDAEVRALDEELEHIALRIPNMPDPDVPIGASETENVDRGHYGTPRTFDFAPKAHWDLGTDLGILDFERAGRMTGARFAVYMGLGARLERSLINFMLDLHTREHGFTEVFPPLIINYDSLVGTGQFPKFTEDVFKLEGKEYYLNPTAEVPVTNLHRDEIIDGDKLPIYYTAYCPSFRAEAGAAGRDTRGLIRMHQFNKVELVKFVAPETSEDELQSLLKQASRVLELLRIPYRVLQMCTGDLGFTAAKKYDLELWLPSYDRYMEISSCSNFRDFQARRANIKYRPEPGARAEYLHTLNGSGLAVDRLVAGVLENYQQADGSVLVPEVLRPYMGVDVITRV